MDNVLELTVSIILIIIALLFLEALSSIFPFVAFVGTTLLLVLATVLILNVIVDLRKRAHGN